MKRIISELRPRRYPIVETGSRQGKLDSDHASAIPNMTTFPQGDSYFHYRCGVMSASLPNEPKIAPFSFTADRPFSVGYTDLDQQMIDRAAELCGFKRTKISDGRSKEPEEIHKNSPVNHNGGRHK